VLGLGGSHFIDERQPLIEIGLDSLMAVEFRNQLASAFSRQFSVTLLFDYPSLGALADFILGADSPAKPEKPDLDLQVAEGLSDQEAEELLKAELGG
jgi:acyl carrier protein